MRDLISVIIPVYKTELYLCDCLDSVLASTYTNLEVILVDDGSPDDCGTICDWYATKDSRIIVIHQDNQGLPAARNAGLACARGEYVGFVDSDDKISKNMYEELILAIKEDAADIAACEWTRYEEELHQFNTEEILSRKNHTVIGTEQCLRVVTVEFSTRNYTYTHCGVWDKLYRREKIQQLFIIDSVPAEDLLFNWAYVKECTKMVIVPMALYYWRINTESITHNKDLDRQIMLANSWLKIAGELSILTDKGYNINDNVLEQYLFGMGAYWAHNALWNVVGKRKEALYPEFVKQTRNTVKKYFRKLILSKETAWKVRIPAILFRYCEPIWKVAARLYQRYR